MKVNLKILLPSLAAAIGRNELEVEFNGETVKDLIEHLVAMHGQEANDALLDETGALDSIIQVLVNGEEWVTHDKLDTVLKDGDNVILMIMMAGG
jgi:MoaD family protein